LRRDNEEWPFIRNKVNYKQNNLPECKLPRILIGKYKVTTLRGDS